MIKQFMADQNIIDDAVGLKEIAEHINNLTPQCPPSFRTETHEIKFIPNVVLVQPCAENAVGNIKPSKYNFKATVTALREQLQLEIEKKSPASSFDFFTLYRQFFYTPQ